MSRTEQMIFAAIILAMLLAGVAAQADTATVTWTNATTREDGTSLPSSQLEKTEVQYGTCASTTTFGTASGQVFAMGAATSAVIDNLGVGTWCFRARHYAFASATPSAWSNVVQKIVTSTSPPKPPTLQTVSVVAYELQNKGKSSNTGFVDVGRVALGVPCDASRTQGGYFGIPAEAVTTTRKYQGGELWGKCA